MADVRNCPRCGRLFTYFSRPICNQCADLEEEEFKRVKEYLWDNKGASIPEVSQNTGVTVEKIMRFLREERLEISSDSENMVLECETCGKPIQSGRFCKNCKDNLGNSLRREFNLDKRPEPSEDDFKKKDGDKMFTATRRPK